MPAVDLPRFPLPSLPAATRLSLSGFRIGHGSDLAGKTGVTVILCEAGMVAAAEVRGSATGTRQFDSLVGPQHLGSRAHAVVLAGGSGFGLSAADPVVDWLARNGHGFQTGIAPIPLVPTAILFDLGFGSAAARPTAALSEEALADALSGPEMEPSEIAVGSVGAGTGATVGKALGLPHGMKGGFGFASLSLPGNSDGATVCAAVAVNAFGDVRTLDGTLLAGCRTAPDSNELASAERVMAALPPDFASPWEGNTTLAVVMTDAILSKPAAHKVCQMAFGGFYRTLVPALSLYDGDLIVTLAAGRRTAHVHQIGVLAERAVAEAILTAVRAADGFGLLPAVRDLAAAG